ncbi:hypothetical protein B0H13DRAFT_1942517 [Mycena leptocephala]|nr:hypothetical protein B0H13DRAFT_1942517 [Mycena leptocephala]
MSSPRARPDTRHPSPDNPHSSCRCVCKSRTHTLPSGPPRTFRTRSKAASSPASRDPLATGCSAFVFGIQSNTLSQPEIACLLHQFFFPSLCIRIRIRDLSNLQHFPSPLYMPVCVPTPENPDARDPLPSYRASSLSFSWHRRIFLHGVYRMYRMPVSRIMLPPAMCIPRPSRV